MMLADREKCTGCGSCAGVCPKNCIQMVADAEGFLYPEADMSVCIRCGKCAKACAVLHPPRTSQEVQAVAAQNRDHRVRQESSSGGVFTALAETVIGQGGAVCAAVYDQNFAPEHRLAFSVEELAPMRGAKYAQSHAAHLFGQIKDLLAQGTGVMFVGTPCQCAGLKAYLGKEEPGLLLVDMICHGVPSPAVWKSYVERRNAIDAPAAGIAGINLREKSTGWSRYAYSVRYEYTDGGVYSVPQGQDPYMKGFVSDLYCRPSCARCSFKGIGRAGDLTLGDCWGIWDVAPEFDDDKGTSVLLIQSPKGRLLWEQIRQRFVSMELNMQDALRCNPSAVTSSKAHEKRSVFFSRFGQEPVDTLICRLLTPEPKQNLFKRGLRRLIHRSKQKLK